MNRVQVHLRNVYATLWCTALLATVGVYIDLAYQWSGILSVAGASIGLLLAFGSNGSYLGFLGLGLGGFCMGINSGLAVGYANPVNVQLALALTTLTFGWFSVVAFWAKDKYHLGIAGVLGSVLACWVRVTTHTQHRRV